MMVADGWLMEVWETMAAARNVQTTDSLRSACVLRGRRRRTVQNVQNHKM